MTIAEIYFQYGGWSDPGYRVSALNVKWRAITVIKYNELHPESVLSVMVPGMSGLC